MVSSGNLERRGWVSAARPTSRRARPRWRRSASAGGGSSADDKPSRRADSASGAGLGRRVHHPVGRSGGHIRACPYSLVASRFSGFDPVVGPKADIRSQNNWSQPTSPSPRSKTRTAVRRCRACVLTPGGDYETPRVHHTARRRGDYVAARASCRRSQSTASRCLVVVWFARGAFA